MSEFDDLKAYTSDSDEEDTQNDAEQGSSAYVKHVLVNRDSFLNKIFFNSKTDGDTYAAVHATSFDDLLLSEPITRALADRGFEHPSEGML